MVRIIGNRPERIRLKDLGDTIFYRQVKEFTDQEFNESKDLQKAVKEGGVIVVNKETASRGSIPDGHVAVPAQGLNVQELRKIIREENNRDSLKDMVPILADLIRQEVSGFKVQQQIESPSTFIDPAYAPNVSTEGMKANINLESREVKTTDLSSALDALRKFKNPNP